MFLDSKDGGDIRNERYLCTGAGSDLILFMGEFPLLIGEFKGGASKVRTDECALAGL